MSKRWLGNAAATVDLWTVALSGTVTSQLYSFTINAKTVAYTSTGGDTPATILAAFISAWNASTIPEFQELTAAGVGTVGAFTGMTLTQDNAGIPSVITVATGGAATFSITNTVAATGPKFFDNTQNWSGGVVPANGDNLVWDNGSVDCCYNISTSLTGLTLNFNAGYSGKIGLPLINSNGQTTYNEYRTTSLTVAGGTAIINCPTIKQCNLAFGATTTMVRILNVGQRVSQYIPVILLTGGNGSSELDLVKADCGVAFYQGQTANFPVIKSAYAAQPLSDVTLILGAGCTLGTLNQNGGNVTVSANITTATMDTAGGTLTLTDAVTATTINAFSGTVRLSTTGTVGTINLYGTATLTADFDPRSHTITNPIQCFASTVTVIDSAKTINSGVRTLAMNGLQSVNLQLGGLTSLVGT